MTRKLAVGVVRGRGERGERTRQVVVRMDDEQFGAVEAYARANGFSWSEAIRTLVEIAREELALCRTCSAWCGR